MFPTPIEQRGRAANITYRVTLWVSLVIWLLPLIAVALTSVRTLEDITRGNYWGWPTEILWYQNYVEAFTRTPLARYMLNSVLITVPTVIGSVALATMAGFALAQYRISPVVLTLTLGVVVAVFMVTNIGVSAGLVIGFLVAMVVVAWLLRRSRWPGELLLFAMFIAGNFIPFQILMIPVRELTLSLGLYDSIQGLILFHIAFQTGFCVLFMRNFIKALPPELLEAARMDGANEFQLFWFVILPLVRPALAALAVLIFTFIWNDYFWALVLVQSDGAQPITAGIQALRGQWVASWQLISAGSIIAALPPVIMFFAMQRHFIAGLTLGAVK